MSVADKLPYWIMLEEDILRKMVKGTENKPVVLQVLPELEMGGVEIGTVEIAGGLQKKGIKNFFFNVKYTVSIYISFWRRVF